MTPIWVTHAIILCTLSSIVASYDPVSVQNEDTAITSDGNSDGDARHIIFFGDSLIRYQYLAYVYKLHFHTEVVPGYLINEKLFANWHDFFENTTAIFNGAMTCDCYREASVKRLASARENRRYVHPSGHLVASYFPLMGYFPIQGMNQSVLRTSFGHERPQPDWIYRTPYAFVQNHLSRVTPPPSVVFVNSGHWNNKQIAKNPRVLLEMLEKVVLAPYSGGSVVTRPDHMMNNMSTGLSSSRLGTTATGPDASGRVASSESEREKCVAWLGTTKPNMAWWAGSRDADWHIIQGRYCSRSLSHTSTTPHERNASEPFVSMIKSCVFVPFGGQGIVVKTTDYFDHMHFSNETIYHLRTSNALQACNIHDSVYG